MNEQELKSELKAIIAEIAEIDDFGDDEEFIRDLGIDSMMSIEIVARLEKRFKIEIPEEYLPQFKTVNDVCRVVLENIEQTEKSGV